MKVRTSLRKMCNACQYVSRGRKNYVVCKNNPRHKQRQKITAPRKARFSTVSECALVARECSLSPAAPMPTGLQVIFLCIPQD